PSKPTTSSVIDQQSSSNIEKNIFMKYSSDEHLLSLLQQHSNPLKQIIITIIGGDSYSLFTWDWYERMHEISNDTNKCHCFIIAMDEIAIILAIKQGVPVYYSTFTFEQQLKWINTIEARQHSLYRVGHAKFNTAAKIIQMGYSVFLSEMDVFWRANPLDHLKKPIDIYDLQISDHFGSHPRVNVGLFFVQSTTASIEFFSYVTEFWLRYGKGAYLSDQRVLDALLKNYDRLDKIYLKAIKSAPSLNWTTHVFGNHFSHLMTDGSAFILFNQAAKLGIRSKMYHGNANAKYFTVTISNTNMKISYRNLLIRALLILQHTHLQNRTLILPAFASNLTTTTIFSQFDVKKFLLYWSDERIRLPNFLLHETTRSIPITNISFSLNTPYENINGILNFAVESIPINLPAPTSQFEVFVRDSLLWCSPPIDGGTGWCIHHPKDFGATMELLFACRGDPYPPCANKTEKNEQFLHRPFEYRKTCFWIGIAVLISFLIACAIIGIVLGLTLSSSSKTTSSTTLLSSTSTINSTNSTSSTSTTTTTTTTVAISIACSNTGRGVLAFQNQTTPTAWTSYSRTFTSTSASHTILFGFQTDGTNSFYLDTVSVVDSTLSSPQLLTNPNFENSTTTPTGWTVSCEATTCGLSAANIANSSQCSSGYCFESFCTSGRTALIFLSQTFATTSGNLHTVTYMLKRTNIGSSGFMAFYLDVI
ncbi:unnamed protein product, partial [Rotaria sordida]